MANLEMNFPDDFLKDLLDADFEEIAEEALSEVSPIMEKSIKDSISKVMKKPDGSELLKSIKATKPKRTRTDAFIVNVGPSGVGKTHYNAKDGSGKRTQRKYPVSNALKAIWLEYGNRDEQQPPRPWLTTATKNAESKILDVMQEVYNKRTNSK